MEILDIGPNDDIDHANINVIILPEVGVVPTICVPNGWAQDQPKAKFKGYSDSIELKIYFVSELFFRPAIRLF